MADLRRIFVDTSAWLSLMNNKDRYHNDAVMFHRGVDPHAVRMTTWGIVAETYTWLRYHLGARHAQTWLQEETTLQTRRLLDVTYPTALMELGIHRNLSRFADQDLSYVDALSLYIVETHGDIDAIFAFDHHLALTGKPVLPGPLGSLTR